MLYKKTAKINEFLVSYCSLSQNLACCLSHSSSVATALKREIKIRDMNNVSTQRFSTGAQVESKKREEKRYVANKRSREEGVPRYDRISRARLLCAMSPNYDCG